MCKPSHAFLLSILFVCLASAESEPVNGPIPLLERRVADNPGDVYAWNRLAGLYLERLRGTGDLSDLPRARHAAETSVEQVPPRFNAAGLLARGQVELASHRFTEARATALEYREWKPEASAGWQLLGDAEFELGQYAEAAKAVSEIVRIDEQPTVTSETRLAKLDWIHGRRESSRSHLEATLKLAQAPDLSIPSAVAWCMVQLGELAFSEGDFASAEKQYTAALGLLPAWFPAQEHMAELLGALGRYDEAITAYHTLLARVDRPELCQALGDLYVLAKQPAEARSWHERAAKTYRESVAAGEILFLHHGAGFFVDSLPEPATALAWATKDMEGRQSVQAWDALAWAQEASGDVNAAAVSIKKALATGIQDSHIQYHAGMILISSGDVAGGKAALKHCVEINPRYQTFHVHR